MKPLRYIFLTLVLLSPLCLFAQSSIDAAISSLEKSKSVTNEVFSERRDPSTRAVIRSNRLFNFDSNKIASKLIEAIKKERSKATSFQMNTATGQEAYTISFDDGKGLHTKYVLVRGKRGDWVLSIDKTLHSKRQSKSRKDRSDYRFETPDILDDIFTSEDLLQAWGTPAML